MPAFIDMLGKKFGRLTFIERIPRPAGDFQSVMWRCRCDCGNETIIRAASARYGRTQSCGCLNKEICHKLHTKHGMSYTRIHRVWAAMKQRCENPKSIGFENYGGRGITVCKRWQTFKNFFEDMGEPRKGMTIERIDNNAGYSPENCRWATQSEQMDNTRRTHFVTFGGKTLNIKQWANHLGISRGCMMRRIRTWKPELAFVLPKIHARSSRAISLSRRQDGGVGS